MISDMPRPTKTFMRQIAAQGGRATGDAKRRDPAHYQRTAKAGNEAKAKLREEGREAARAKLAEGRTPAQLALSTEKLKRERGLNYARGWLDVIDPHRLDSCARYDGRTFWRITFADDGAPALAHRVRAASEEEALKLAAGRVGKKQRHRPLVATRDAKRDLR